MPTAHLDSEVRRHQIVHTARKIVANHGMAFFTIQELAKEVGVSEGAIYRHFRSKDEILLALVHEIERTLMDGIAESARPGEGALDQLRHLLQRHFSSMERRNGSSFVVISEAPHFADPRVKRAAREMVERYVDTIAAILKGGIDSGEIDEEIDTRAAALMFFGMIEASVTLWAFSNRAHPLAQHSNSLWAIFKGGLIRRPREEGGATPASATHSPSRRRTNEAR